MDFVIWRYRPFPGACALKDLRGLDKTYRLNNGTPLAADFPAGIELHMDPDSPDDLLLGDNVMNADMLIVASRRLRDALESHDLRCVEFLPVTIIDHKGRTASQDHCIVHPTNPVDAIDREQSVFETDLLDEDDIVSFEKLAVEESRIPSDRSLLRLKGFWDLTLVRRDLADALGKLGFSGLSWLEVAAYPEG